MTRFAIVLTALFLWLFGATAAQAARSEFFGIVQGPALDAQDLQGMQAAGVRTVRFLLLWRDVQPSQGSFDWGTNDLIVGRLASHGVRPAPFLYGSPTWVGSGEIRRPPIDSAADEQAWADFLKAAVARYGPGGSYWANEYPQQFGADAVPLPVQSWQIWNEPNIKQYFGPGSTTQQLVENYAKLLAISHDAIKSQDTQAEIVLAGLYSETQDVTPSTFLDNLYGVAGAKANFDAAALHPYGCNLDQTRDVIANVRAVMTNRGDAATPLWLTELAWGSAPPDQFCRNKGLTGHRDLLSSSYTMILENRTNWNVQRVFWFLWRDPEPGSPYANVCRICATPGLLLYDRTPKPAYSAFTAFTAETTPPVASITSGPDEGSFTKNRTPTFSFASNEPGSTFVCRFDESPFTACSSPRTRAYPLPDGAHAFYVKAIDAPGNESQVVSRSFTVDTVSPQTTITSGPSELTTDYTPTFTFSSSESGSTFACRFDSQPFAPCSGPGASDTPSTPLSPGSHRFEVRATDEAKNTDPTPAASTAGAARTEFFGIAQGPVLDAQDLQGMRATRIRTDRFLLLWPKVQPSQGSFDWGPSDLVVGGLAKRGIRPVPFIFGSPGWVGSGKLSRPPIDSAADEQAWADFLKAAVARYRPGGSYWANEYHDQFGESALPLPIQSWQIWNEPNTKHYFAPAPSAQEYARLLAISHDAIKSRDPQARIVLAGLFSEGEVNTWTFLDNLYGVAGVKADFDAAALHPYRCNLDQTRDEIMKFRAAMTSHADGATPLWLTEFAWGSGPAGQFCRNKGLTGQRDLLSSSFKLILQNRTAWNVQRLFWFVWRDPAPGSAYANVCRICGTAGLLNYDRSPKPAYSAFRGFTAETTAPVASITSGPVQGSFIKDSTPTFSLASNEAGSTFVCRFDSGPFTACRSPYTRGTALTDGAHIFYVKAIDAPGNESQVVSRSFTVDTVPPQTTITSGPSGLTTDATPTFTFSSSESGSTFQCRFNSQAFAPCSGPGASHTPSTPLFPASHSFEVRAVDRAKNTDPTPAKSTFTVVIP